MAHHRPNPLPSQRRKPSRSLQRKNNIGKIHGGAQPPARARRPCRELGEHSPASAMRISKIESQKKHPHRKSVFADDQFLIGLDNETLARSGLRVGDMIDPSTIIALQNAEDRLAAKHAALRFLSHRPRTVREIRDKLREREFADAAISATIEDLTAAGLLNDAEFARMYVRDAVTLRSTGKLLLKRKMLLLGLDRETTETAIEEAFKDIRQDQVALLAARKFMKKARESRKGEEARALRNRLVQFLGRRGFGWDVIPTVVRNIFDEQISENEG
jgi:regulatory protein